MSDHPHVPETTSESLVCYRHPDRETRVRCTRCDRPICSEDMITAPVGFQCPECSRGGQQARTIRNLYPTRPTVTYVMLALIALGYLGQQIPGTELVQRFSDWGVAIAAGQWWRAITGGFLHGSLIHIGFNAYLLYRIGQMLEPQIGHLRFGLLYLAGLLGGSLGAVLLSPLTPAIGASGAVFALMAAIVVALRRRGINPWQNDIGVLLLLNLVITFVFPGISIGGHLGGAAVGAIVGVIYSRLDRREHRVLGAVLVGALAVGVFVATLVAADLRVPGI